MTAVVVKTVLSLIAGVSFAQPSIRVRSHVQLAPEKSTIQLGDVADLQGFNDHEKNELCRIALGDAPAEDESRTLTNFALSEVLRGPMQKIERNYHDKISLSLPRHVFIEKAISAARIGQAIAHHFQESCGGCEIRVSDVRLPVVIGSVDQWKINFPSDVPKGSFSIPVDVNSVGKDRVIWASGKLMIFKKVPIAKRNINIGERIQPSDVGEELRDITFANDGPVENIELVGSTAARGIAARQIIWKNYLVRPKAISRGEAIKLISGGDTWQITVSGIAQQSGYIGDTVQVTNASSQKSLTGIVVDKGVVKIR